MHKRRGILLTAMLILCLTLAMIPLTDMLSSGENQEQDALRQAIADTISIQRKHESRPPDVAVMPCMDIEDVWAIEDTRREAGQQLVKCLKNGKSRLGYDREQDTFYCTIGMETGDDWPQIQLFAESDAQEELHIAWVDDYTYDYPCDAMEDEYRYELIAYTDTQYAYIGVVFTGLPIVTMDIFYDGEVEEQYVPAHVSVAGAGYEAIDTAALTHMRGGGVYKGIDKFSYRIQFHDEMGRGSKKTKDLSVLGMEEDSDWLLICNAQEETAARNYLAYEMWKMWHADEPAPMKLESELVELFVDDEYMGLYQLMERVDAQEEILGMGGDLQTDSAVRLVIASNRGEKPSKSYGTRSSFFAEYRYGPGEDADAVFERFDAYARMNEIVEDRPDDEEFAELAQKYVDLDSALNYYLFMQACGLSDNVINNLYVWMMEEEGRMVYKFSPWDMDYCLLETGFQEDGSVVPYFEEKMVFVHRMLDLNLMNSRERLWEIWQEKRKTILSDAAVWDWIMDMQTYLNASGAYRRESNKWRGGAYQVNMTPMLDFELEHLWTVESTLAQRWPLED